MNEVVLGDSGLRTTQLGFGCARLFRIPTARQRQRVLETAFDTGIRHFDIARMYGLGRAESEVGRFAADKRSQLVLATKFGIEPRGPTMRLAGFQFLARTTLRWLPALRRAVCLQTQRLYRAKEFSVTVAQRSLETSLRELNTDYVDLFLLHEPTMDDVIHDDLIAYLEKSRDKGQIRAFGLAGEFDDVRALSASRPNFAEIIQIPNDILNCNLARLEPNPHRGIISFSPFSRALEFLAAEFRVKPQLARDWSSAIGCDLQDTNVLARFLLKDSLINNPNGVTLLSTSRPERISSLVSVVCREDAHSAAQVERFASLAARMCAA